ncbi:hypothetical protein SteCoe_25180 [Stentor coeruleus]|uniref:Uncharacterized protein n=1 Tax=Stentor coeruleus TaxID=5963 RepID=A0A1R2BG03_9CILI|nr:hypothetical protein SteCoe_25180 [Stentor coeruleus]
MLCGRSRNVVVNELASLLKFIENENSQYERERNELKDMYHSRPHEERNIVKDILIMHNDFDGGVNKIKEIVDELVVIPTEKTVTAEKAENFASQIVAMQAALVRKHDILQKCLGQKLNYQRLKEESQSSSKEVSSENDQFKFKCLEISNFEHYNIYSKKLKFLNTEIQRLKTLIKNSTNESFDEKTLFDTDDNNIMMLNDKQAYLKFQQVLKENKRIEEEIGRLNIGPSKESYYLKDKLVVDDKRKRVFELKKKLSDLNEEIEKLKGSKEDDDCSRKIRILDSIIGRKTSMPNMPVSPKGKRSKNSILLQDIEASLSKVKSISSPIRHY